jgi:hypothetical protein
MMEKKPEVILLYETVAQSWARDASTFALLLCLIGMGVILQSSAMQWFGAVVGFIVICNRAGEAFKKNRMTIDQARKRLDEIEAAR